MWTVRLPDDALTIDPARNALVVDVRDLPVVDDRGEAGETPATVTFQISWTGRGRRFLAGAEPDFAGHFFARAKARGRFAASSDGFAFASSARKAVRSRFAMLGTEENGVFLDAATRCARCAAPVPVAPAW